MGVFVNKVFIFLLISAASFTSFAQTIEWQKNFGGSEDDYSNTGQQTLDGGYIFTGLSNSIDGDLTGNNGDFDVWLIKVDQLGNIEWQKSYGGSGRELSRSIQQTNDGGYIFSASTGSDDFDVSSNHGSVDIWVVKVDEMGNIEWEKSYGGTKMDIPYTTQQTTDGGYITAGWSESDNGDLSGNYGNRDSWVLKLDANGNIEWQKNYGGSNMDVATDIQQTLDGGYVLVSWCQSNDGDTDSNNGGSDYWILKIDENGNIEWSKNYGGSSEEVCYDVQQTYDGGYTVLGHSFSSDGDVSNNNGSMDYWLIKVDANGNLLWEKNYGGSFAESASSLEETTDKGFIIAGHSNSIDGDVSDNNGNYDAWLIKTDSIGNLLWEKNYGGSDLDISTSVKEVNVNEFIVTGHSGSIDGDLNGNNGSIDAWNFKISSNLSNIQNINNGAQILVQPNPSNGNFSIKIDDVNEPFLITIYNVMGKLIYAEKHSGKKVEIKGIPKGIYWVNMNRNNMSSTKRIIIH